MKIKVLVCFGGLILAIGVLIQAFVENYYIEQKAYRDARILWNDKEAFVFVGKEINGFVGSRVSFVLASLAPMHSLVTDHSSDLIVIHLDKTGCSVYNHTECQYSGNAFIYNGNLYFEHDINKAESLVVLKWNGTKFVKLEANEAQKILASFTLFDDLLKKEGWSESEIWFDAKGTNIAIPLESLNYKMSFKRDKAENVEQELVVLKNGTNTDQHGELVKITREMRKVSKGEYSSRFPSHKNW
jgi:hypothetical protein